MWPPLCDRVTSQILYFIQFLLVKYYDIRQNRIKQWLLCKYFLLLEHNQFILPLTLSAKCLVLNVNGSSHIGWLHKSVKTNNDLSVSEIKHVNLFLQRHEEWEISPQDLFLKKVQYKSLHSRFFSLKSLFKTLKCEN